MAATPFVVSNTSYLRTPRRNAFHSAVVVAENSTDALAVLQSLYADTALWGASATATAMIAGADLAGWKLRINIQSAILTLLGSVEVTGAASATVDSIAALAVTALNAAGLGIANASYNAGTNVLTVAGAADNKGACKMEILFYPPNSEVKSIPGFVGAITHGGATGAALTVQLATDAYTVPGLTAKLKSLGPEH